MRHIAITLFLAPWACGVPVELLAADASSTHEPTFVLSDQCPPSFERSRDGLCEFRSVYQLYGSPEGFGGLRVALPPGRDRFPPKVIDLGRLIFFDPLLSSKADMSCAHCHHPHSGLADGHARSRGRGAIGAGPERTGGIELPRGAPSLWNVRFLQRLNWDGKAPSLEEQATIPLFSPDEMGNTRERLEARLRAHTTYRRLFTEAFHLSDPEDISVRHVVEALAAFQSTLVSLNSRYDHYAHGDEAALTEQEKRGHAVFRSFTVRCSQCHTPPLFTNGELAVIGAPEPEGLPFDPGAGRDQPDPSFRGAFRVPSLRNISQTAPYMHSGRFASLADVVSFYDDRRGHAVPADESLAIHWHIALSGTTLTKAEADDLIAFLRTLEDDSMLPSLPTRVPSGLPVVAAPNPLSTVETSP